MAIQYRYSVSMSCSGCSNSIERVLKKLEGVQSYDVSLADQTVTVRAEDFLSCDKVLETIKKTGKTVNSVIEGA